jgi:hypothetical protein
LGKNRPPNRPATHPEPPVPINRAFQLAPGLKLAATLEPVLGPQWPRQFWDSAKGAWTADRSARVPVVEDPGMPGLYFLQVPDDQSAGLDDWAYRAVITNAGAAKAEVALVIELFVVNGSDAAPLPSASFQIAGIRYVGYGLAASGSKPPVFPAKS